MSSKQKTKYIRVSPYCTDNDLNHKAGTAKRLLKQGHKVCLKHRFSNAKHATPGIMIDLHEHFAIIARKCAGLHKGVTVTDRNPIHTCLIEPK